MFDEQPDGDPHGECEAEIRRLQRELDDAKRLLDDAAHQVPAGYQQFINGKWEHCSAFLAFGFRDEMFPGFRAVYAAPVPAGVTRLDPVSTAESFDGITGRPHSSGVAASDKVQMPDKARAGIEVLHCVIESLLTTSRYVDEEGEATQALADLSDCIADPPFKLATGVRVPHPDQGEQQ